MPVRWYRPQAAGTELDLYIDPQKFVKTADQADLLVQQEIAAASDTLRTELAIAKGFPDLVTFDTDVEDKIFDLQDRIDYYDYEDRLQNLSVRDGAWFSPIAVESFCAEDVGDEAVDSIDGNFATFWRDSTNHQHTIVYELRSYPKKIAKIRFRYGASESARERLNNMDVHASKGIGNIDDPANILETGINIVWPTGAGEVWVEHTLAQKKNKARYVKLVIDDTDNGNNQIQIREFEVRVETRDP